MTEQASSCQRCNQPLGEGARYCSSCGVAVGRQTRALRRRRADEQFAGICSGLAEYFDVDPTLMRVIYLAATVFTGIVPGVILYIILVFVIPTD